MIMPFAGVKLKIGRIFFYLLDATWINPFTFAP